jgi:hypothetical protein
MGGVELVGLKSWVKESVRNGKVSRRTANDLGSMNCVSYVEL